MVPVAVVAALGAREVLLLVVVVLIVLAGVLAADSLVGSLVGLDIEGVQVENVEVVVVVEVVADIVRAVVGRFEGVRVNSSQRNPEVVVVLELGKLPLYLLWKGREKTF